jgi:hypothetical protein
MKDLIRDLAEYVERVFHNNHGSLNRLINSSG